jgi:transcriptional regulator with XRE-family HTH domain
MITTTGERIRLLRKTLGLSAVELSKKTSINRTYISDVEGNKREPSRNFLDSLNKTFNASYDWLLTGKGTMFLPEEDDASNGEATADEIINEIMRLLANMDEQGKQAVLLSARQAERIARLEKKFSD